MTDRNVPCETAIELRVKQGVLESRLDGLTLILGEIRDEIKLLRPATLKMNILWGAAVAIGASGVTLAVTMIGRLF